MITSFPEEAISTGCDQEALLIQDLQDDRCSTLETRMPAALRALWLTGCLLLSGCGQGEDGSANHYGELVATVGPAVLSHQIADLQPGTTYTFVMTAFDTSDNESAPSGQVSVTPAAPLAPGSGKAIVKLSWSPNTEEDLAGFRIYLVAAVAPAAPPAAK